MSDFDNEQLIGQINTIDGNSNEEFTKELAKLMEKHKINQVEISWRKF